MLFMLIALGMFTATADQIHQREVRLLNQKLVTANQIIDNNEVQRRQDEAIRIREQ